MTIIGFISQVSIDKSAKINFLIEKLAYLDWWSLGTVHGIQFLIPRRTNLLVHIPNGKKCRIKPRSAHIIPVYHNLMCLTNQEFEYINGKITNVPFNYYVFDKPHI